jgi:hypothetical protein
MGELRLNDGIAWAQSERSPTGHEICFIIKKRKITGVILTVVPDAHAVIEVRSGK